MEVTVGANAADDKPVDKDAWPELLMPRDSHMLPEHSQQLLRAARSGRIFKPPAPPEDDNEMKDEEEENKEIQTGFTIKKYVKVARHLEVSEPEYLAKRRKGLPSPYVVNGVIHAPLRETKVKKLDAEGNATVYKVLVPEGQAVEGEVQPTDAAIEAIPAVAAPGTVVEGVGVVNAEGVVVANDILQQTPPRRRNPPPPKKRKAGPGRSKKKVIFIEGSANPAGGEQLAVPGIKAEGGSGEPSDGDTPMANAGGDDEEGSGEEGSDDEENDANQASAPDTPATPSKTATAPTSVPKLDANELAALDTSASVVEMTDAPRVTAQPLAGEIEAAAAQPAVLEVKELDKMPDPSSSPDLPLSAISHSRQNSLTHVPTSTTDPEPMPLDPLEPAAEAPAPVAIEPEPTVMPDVPVLPPVIEAVPEPVIEPITESSIAPSVEPVVPPVVETLDKDVPAPTAEVPATMSEPKVVEPPTTSQPEQVSAPPSEPDLMGSLERHLEESNEDIGRS